MSDFKSSHLDSCGFKIDPLDKIDMPNQQQPPKIQRLPMYSSQLVQFHCFLIHRHFQIPLLPEIDSQALCLSVFRSSISLPFALLYRCAKYSQIPQIHLFEYNVSHILNILENYLRIIPCAAMSTKTSGPPG